MVQEITPQTALALAKAIREAGLPRFSIGPTGSERDAYVGFVLWTWAKEMAREDREAYVASEKRVWA